jgi:thiamine pyrophosphate-dependent acetolactate synthase large subunit-like protein
VRSFIKWDAQPASVPAAQEALLRAWRIADTAPRGPTYVCFDAALQEAKLAQRPALPDVARYAAPGLARACRAGPGACAGVAARRPSRQ